MPTRQKTLFFLQILILSLFVSCEKKHENISQHLRLNIGVEPQSLDPRKARTINDINLTKMLFDGLVRYNKDGKIECALAKVYNISKDQKSYTFYLKEAYWSNNKAITIDDFIYSYETVLSPKFICGNVNFLYVIKNAKNVKDGLLPFKEAGIKAIDQNTLVFELEKPCPYFLELLAQPIFFPINKNNDISQPLWTNSDKNFVSSGPFILKKWKFNDYIEFVKNNNYYDSTNVSLQKISCYILQNLTEQNMFEANELDLFGSPFSFINSDSMKHLKLNKNFISKPSFGTVFLRVNTTKIDKNLRKFLNTGIDREKIVNNILQGGEKQTLKFVPTKEEQKISIIKEKLEDVEISLSFVNNEKYKLIAQAIQNDWQQNLNIKVSLNPLESKVFFSKLNNLDYDVALSTWIGDFLDPINFLEVFQYKNNSVNNTGWENQKYISCLLNSEEKISKSERKKLLIRAEEILIDENPIIPLYHMSYNFMKNDSLKNLKIYPSGFVDLKYVYFE